MKINTKIKIGIYSFMLVFFMGCKPENSLNVQPDKDQFELKSQKEKLAADFAKMLASSLNQEELRQHIKSKGLQKFDGDYDILFTKEKHERIQVKTGKFKNSSPTLAELIVGSANNGRFKSDNASNEYIDSLNKLYPLLQIAIPELPNASIETWDTENHIPLVAVSVSEKDEYIKAFDSDGNIHWLEMDTPPDELVIVVGANERIKVIPKESTNKSLKRVCLPEEPYYSDENNDYYLKTDYYNAQNNCILPDPDDGGTGPGTETTTCDRDRNSSKDILEKVKFKTHHELKKAEPWTQGAIEVACFVIFGNSTGEFASVKLYFTGARGSFKNCSWLFNCEAVWMTDPKEVLTWKKEDYGDKMKYKWYEEDADDWAVTSSTIEHTESLSTKIGNTTYTNSTKFTITNKDYDLGHAYVEYCDNTDGAGKDYYTGRFYFTVKQ